MVSPSTPFPVLGTFGVAGLSLFASSSRLHDDERDVGGLAVATASGGSGGSHRRTRARRSIHARGSGAQIERAPAPLALGGIVVVVGLPPPCSSSFLLLQYEQ